MIFFFKSFELWRNFSVVCSDDRLIEVGRTQSHSKVIYYRVGVGVLYFFSEVEPIYETIKKWRGKKSRGIRSLGPCFSFLPYVRVVHLFNREETI